LFPIPFLQALSNHYITIKQLIENEKLSDADFAEIFNQSDIFFPTNSEELFSADEQELIAFGKYKAFEIISQVELANCIQRNHV
jgi:phage portal protein BeeE